MDPKTKALLIILFIAFLLELIWHFLIKDPPEARVAKKDLLLLKEYVDDYYRIIWIDIVFIVTFILYGRNNFPGYIFSPIYHAIFIFFGFITLSVCYLTFKHGFTISFNKSFIGHQAINKFWGLFKYNILKGAYIRMRGIKAKLMAVFFLIFGIILIFLGVLH